MLPDKLAWVSDHDDVLQGAAGRILPDAPRREFAGLHLVGHGYPGRRPDALRWPAWAQDDRSLEALARLYQRSIDEFLRLSGPERTLVLGEEVPVPDRGFVPHLAARLAAEVLA